MDKIIGILATSLIIILPLIKFYQRSNWTKLQGLIGIVGLSLLWFFTATPLHELSHLIGAKMVGVKITEFQLLPEYWNGDFRKAYIKPDIENKIQEFVIRISPYFRDLVIAFIGYALLVKKQIKHSFVVGLIFSFFLLNSVFDIVTNFLGYSIDKDGDLNGLSKIIGHFWTYFLSIGIVLITIILSFRIFLIYKGFPKKI
ncbi:MAG: hypothetical protein ACK5HT_08295 [Draconibacterium sp.]